MSEQPRATHDLFKAAIGDEFTPLEFIITEEMVDRNAWANDDYNPWYMEDSPFGGRIASPTFLAHQYLELFHGHYYDPPGGGLYPRQEFEFINPIRIGKKIRVTGRLIDRYPKKGREYFVSEILATDEDGTEIVRMHGTMAYPAKLESE